MVDRPPTTILTCCHQSSITCTCRYDPGRAEKEECLRLDDIKELLGLELLGVIPESKCILTATNIGQPVICMQDEEAGQGACVRACVHWALGLVVVLELPSVGPSRAWPSPINNPPTLT